MKWTTTRLRNSSTVSSYGLIKGEFNYERRYPFAALSSCTPRRLVRETIRRGD
jgi:hypothetical protein